MLQVVSFMLEQMGFLIRQHHMKLKNFEHSIHIGKYITVRSRLKMHYLSRCFCTRYQRVYIETEAVILRTIGASLVFLTLNVHFSMRLVPFLSLIWTFKVISGDSDSKLSTLASLTSMEHFVPIKDLAFCNKMTILCQLFIN